ncbi:hypothetical protein ACR6C2_34375 [Streptomyces sp. INA 01156]
MDAPLAVFVGRQFAAALSEGLRRSRGTGTARPDVPAPVVPSAGSPTTREDALLAEHAGEILARFDARLQGVPGVTAPARVASPSGHGRCSARPGPPGRCASVPRLRGRPSRDPCSSKRPWTSCPPDPRTSRRPSAHSPVPYA